MAETKAAGVKKKGFFSRKNSEPAPAPAKAPQPGARPATPPKQVPAPPAVEPRLSLESMPEVEKRIDRMHATQRRASLLERYESRYGEKLEVPRIFVPVEEQRPQAPAKFEVPAAALPPAPKAAEVPAAKPAAAPFVEKPSAPAPPAKPAAAPVLERPAAQILPPKETKAPEAKPVSAAARPVEAAKPAIQPSRPLQLPEGMTLAKYLWPQMWPFWGLPLRRFAKAKWPDKKNMVNIMTVVDLPLLALLSIPRLLGIFWAGLVIWAVSKFKKRKAAEAEPVVVAAN